MISLSSLEKPTGVPLGAGVIVVGAIAVLVLFGRVLKGAHV